jgi:glycosyltransferase involved in cell wall biosynthesis
MTKKIKLLRVITRLDLGGSAVHAALLAKQLDPDRYETHFICGSVSQLDEREIEEIRSACASFRVEPLLRREIEPVSDLRALFSLLRTMRRERFDIVHTHTSKAGFVGRAAARLAGVPTVVHSTHGHVFYGYFGPLKSKLIVAAEKLAARATDRVLCLTQSEIEDHLKLGVGTRDLFEVHISGVPIEKFSQPAEPRERVRASLGIPAEAPAIAIAARLDPVKAVGRAIEALSLLDGFDPPPFLLIAGDGEERERLEELARGLGVSDRALFLGLRRDVPDILHASDVFLLTSLNEGYGKAIVEAMSAALPVVATNVGGVSSLVKDGRTGFLIPADDPRAAADALRKILSNPDLAKSMSQAAQAAVSDTMSVDAMVRRVDEIYSALLKPGRNETHV